MSTLAQADARNPTERYARVPAGVDGIGKRYMGRDIASVMGWQGAAWLERAEREREERTDLLVTALQLKPGMAVADIGAGTGYLARPQNNRRNSAAFSSVESRDDSGVEAGDERSGCWMRH